ncbi:hypothetical protein D3C72_1944720 [compost metagenome]
MKPCSKYCWIRKGLNVISTLRLVLMRKLGANLGQAKLLQISSVRDFDSKLSTMRVDSLSRKDLLKELIQMSR